MFATDQHLDPPVTTCGRVEVRSCGQVVLVVPAMTPAKALIDAFRDLDQQGWFADMETLFERYDHEDHIGLVRPTSN